MTLATAPTATGPRFGDDAGPEADPVDDMSGPVRGDSVGDAATESLAVMRLVATGFRNYARVALALDARPVVLVGENGAGKTNLLEAVSYLAPGRGLRNARLAEVTQAMPGEEPAPAWGVAATLTTPEGVIDLGTGIEPGAGDKSDKRLVRIDGTAQSGSGALGHYVRVLWLTPAMDRLFVEGAGGRRRFLDRMVLGFDPGHASRVSAYERAMRERTRLLGEPSWDRSWVAALEQQMAEHGVAIAAARTHVVSQLVSAIAEGAEGAFPRAALALEGDLEAAVPGRPAVEVEDAFRKALEKGRGRDAAAGRALEGPHRTDLRVQHIGKEMPADQCSTGEQKALLIGLVLANARLHAASFGAPPLLLLDEIAAHLDARRRAALFDELDRLRAQAWMTGTDAALFESLGTRAQFFEVSGGTVAPIA